MPRRLTDAARPRPVHNGGSTVVATGAARMSPDPLPPLTLVLGGARSGKSAYAESLFGGSGGAVYVATAEAIDDEMRDRIARHRARRGDRWTTVEAPLDLAGALRAHGWSPARGQESDEGGGTLHAHGRSGRPGVLVDCLTVWLGNLMHAGRDVDREAGRLLESLAAPGAPPAVLVANEVGLGVVPDNPMARAFRDHAGRLNQALAGRADRVVLVTAGLPLVLKPG